MPHRVDDATLQSLRDYSAGSFETAPPPFLSVSGDVLYEIVVELQDRRKAEQR